MHLYLHHPEHTHYSLKREINELYWAMAIKSFGGGLLGIFVPIFVYLYFGQSMVLAVGFYAIQFFLQGLLLPVAAQLIQHVGVKKLMAISHLFLAAYLLLLMLAPEHGIVFICFGIVMKVIYFVLFWPAYHIDFAKFLHKEKRGREISVAGITISVMKAIAPLIGGLIIVRFGFTYVFIASAILIIISSFPLFFSPEVYERYVLDWKKSFTYLSRKRNRHFTLAFFFEGIETMVGIFLFPMFIMLTIGQIDTIGWVTSVALFFALIVTYVVGILIDKKGSRSVLSWGSVLHGLAWFFNLFIATPFSYVLANSFFRLAETTNRLPYVAYSYKKAHDREDGIDEFLVTREMAINWGRFFMALVVIAGMSLGMTSVAPYFIVAGLSALLFKKVVRVKH